MRASVVNAQPRDPLAGPAPPVTNGPFDWVQSREDSPRAGDLYTARIPLIFLGGQRGTITIEFHIADVSQDAKTLAFIEGERTGTSGPRVRWDV